MVAERNGADPFEFADTASRLLEALAALNQDPAAVLPVETAILLAARLHITQQELKEAHDQLRRDMTTAIAPVLPGGAKRLARRGASGITTRIDQPRAPRQRKEAPVEQSPSIEYPADLYADLEEDSVRARVYRVVCENSVDLRHPVANETAQAISFAAGTQASSLRGILDRIRVDLGIKPRKGQGRVTPIALRENAPPPPARVSLAEQIHAVVEERGIDLQYFPPAGFVPEMMERFGRTEDSIKSALKAIRKRLGIRSKGYPPPSTEPGSSPRARQRDPHTGNFVAAAPKNEARALALELVAELRTVDGERRAQALVQAGRLLEKLL